MIPMPATAQQPPLSLCNDQTGRWPFPASRLHAALSRAANDAFHHPVSLLHPPAPNTPLPTTASGNRVLVDIRDDEKPTPVPTTINSLPGNLNLDQLGGLYVLNTAPDSRYLIEVRPELAGAGDFLGSDFLLTLLGLDPDKTQRRLGDAFYENQLIRDALMQQANTRFVGGATDDYEQMEMLMENAAQARSALNLSLGVALSASQVAALTEDILWLVEEVVDGHRVLVPRLYLASVDRNELLPDGSLIKASGGMNIWANTIELDGKISSGGPVIMNSTGNFAQTADIFSVLSAVRLFLGREFSRHFLKRQTPKSFF